MFNVVTLLLSVVQRRLRGVDESTSMAPFDERGRKKEGSSTFVIAGSVSLPPGLLLLSLLLSLLLLLSQLLRQSNSALEPPLSAQHGTTGGRPRLETS